jgi:ATP-dependent DNA helicase DinG
MTDSGTSAGILGANGPFATALEGFAPRDEQIRMAQAVEQALAEQSSLVVEAGTGIGKTLAYLVPALLSEERVIISTGTKTLQDQLFFRDLPLVSEALGRSVRTALLKGRSNYLCLHRMNIARTEGRLPSREAVAELESLRQWATLTKDGDLSISDEVSEEGGLLPLVTSTVDNCLGGECPEFESCFVARARQEAQEADVVVVNHHLLFADMAIKQSGFGEVLPGASAFIVDEAHQAPETASRFFSVSLSSRQLQELCRDLLAESAEVASALGIMREPVADCLQKVKETQAVIAEQLPERGSWAQMVANEAVREALQALDQSVIRLAGDVLPLEGSARGFDGCIDRLREIVTRFDRFDSPAENDEVRWFERRGRGFVIHITPLEVASMFNAFRETVEASWIFTSATLSVRGDFSHFTGQMGLADARTLQLDSPFDYEKNALMWLPENLPEPREPEFIARLVDQVVPLLESSRGRAFPLFTSHRALREAAELLAERIDFPLFIQGERPRSVLLEEFRRSGEGVLLGTASFWEGVDVIGDALSLVVIDKLPFSAPDDPVIEARSSQLRAAGGNPFAQLYLPQAVISLKQGAGRLIRDVRDRGVLVLFDPRIATRSYGRVFLESLPPMRQANSRTEAEQFLND